MKSIKQEITPIFSRTEPPKGKQNFNRYEHCWFVYSPEFYRFLPQIKAAFRQHGPPNFIHLNGYGEYNYTFHVDLDKIDKNLNQELETLIYGFTDFKVGAYLMFFHALINKKIKGELFSFLFGYLRAALVKLSNNEMAALYPPLTITTDENDFPLHCDLYPPKILFNVFEITSKGNDGLSTFFKTSDLLEDALPSLKGFRKSDIQKAERLIYKETGEDRYEAFYSLLYNNHQWSTTLREVLNVDAAKIKFESGQGYMLNDRLWMHGRGVTKQAPTSKRLHRLVFDCY